MGSFDFQSQAGFEPPSDFVAEPQGGGGKKWLKYLGIGCGVFLLIIGILMAVGAFRAVSCCNDFVDLGKRTAEAQQFSVTFAAHLHEGQEAEAYALTTTAYQEGVSLDGFRDQLAPHRETLRAAMPLALNMKVVGDGEAAMPSDANRWESSFRFAPPEARQMAVVTLEIVASAEGAERPFEVAGMRLEQRARDLATEPPAVEVLDLHRELRSGQYEAAAARFAPTYTGPDGASSIDALRALIDAHGEVLTSGALEIRRVEYQTPMRAVVSGRLTGASGATARLDVSLIVPAAYAGWRIDAIQLAPTPDENADAAGRDVAGEDAEAAGEGTADDGDENPQTR